MAEGKSVSDQELRKCRLCKRPLTNPVSVKTGMGPVCRAKEEENRQREFDFVHTETEVSHNETPQYEKLKEGHVIKLNGSDNLYKVVYKDEYETLVRLCRDDSRYSCIVCPSKLLDVKDNIEIIGRVDLDIDF